MNFLLNKYAARMIRLCMFTFLFVPGMAMATNHSLLIQPQELADKMAKWGHGADGVVLIDTRSQTEYLQGHIENAINVDVNKTFHHYQKDKVGSMSALIELLSYAGLEPEQHIVIYSNDKYLNSGRMFWVLELLGFKNVSLLNGGYPLWKKRGYNVSKSINILPEKSQLRPRINVDILKTKLDAYIAVRNQSYILLDARPAKSYIEGRIPDSINIPWSTNYQNEDGVNVIKPVDDLEVIYADIDKDQKVMTYCHKGKQSSFSYFILRYLGYLQPSHYDGSWYEWKQDPLLPKVSG